MWKWAWILISISSNNINKRSSIFDCISYILFQFKSIMIWGNWTNNVKLKMKISESNDWGKMWNNLTMQLLNILLMINTEYRNVLIFRKFKNTTFIKLYKTYQNCGKPECKITALHLRKFKGVISVTFYMQLKPVLITWSRFKS